MIKKIFLHDKKYFFHENNSPTTKWDATNSIAWNELRTRLYRIIRGKETH